MKHPLLRFIDQLGTLRQRQCLSSPCKNWPQIRGSLHGWTILFW